MNREELLKVAKPILFNTDMIRAILEGHKTVTRRVIKKQPDINDKSKHTFRKGDILYVRETWHKYTKRTGKGENCHIAEYFGYKASPKNSEDAVEPWRPSIHMPKEIARLFLKVKEVRVERLQDITENDVRKEGSKWEDNPWVWVIEFEKLEV